jgi:protein gp37
LHWKRPQRIFVNSMSDLFHEDVPDSFIDRVFAIMACCERHIFQVLTKRPKRMLKYLRCRIPDSSEIWPRKIWRQMPIERFENVANNWPLPNVHLGVSIEDQRTAGERIPLLLKTPAAVRFISAEPLLGLVDLDPYIGEGVCFKREDKSHCVCWWDEETARCCSCRQWGCLNWVIVGGESGPGARACDVAWIRSLKDQCQTAGVPVFIKQLGSHSFEEDRNSKIILSDTKGGDIREFPEDLRVREYPHG